MRLLSTSLGATEVSLLISLLYFLPSIVAWLYRRERLPAIFLLNALTGWTILGWFGALKWATIADTRALEEIAPTPRYGAQQKLIIAASILVAALIIQIFRVYDFTDYNSVNKNSPPLRINPSTVSIIGYELRNKSDGLKVDFTFRNLNPFKVKDIAVTCEYAAIDAAVLGAATVTIPRTFEANYDQRVMNVDLGPMPAGTANTSCSITGFAPAE